MNINPGEFVVLVVFAVILFGPEKLPELARKAARVIAYVRNIANNAQDQLREELGPEFANFDMRDLNPKTFVQKHLLDDVEPIVTDIKADVSDSAALVSATSHEMADDLDSVRSDLAEAREQADAVLGAGASAKVPYDREAT